MRKPEQTLAPGHLLGASPVEASAEASPARPKTDVQLFFLHLIMLPIFAKKFDQICMHTMWQCVCAI